MNTGSRTVSSRGMASMFIEMQDRDHRQKCTIRCMAALLAVCMVTISAMAWELGNVLRTMAYQDTVITDQAKVIHQKTVQIAQLEKQAEATRAEMTSRGKDRTATITAYTWTGDKTASGTWPKEGRTVAGPSWIPFGTRVYIDGIGCRIVEDRTHPRFDGRYDVYTNNKWNCILWGKQTRTVQIR